MYLIYVPHSPLKVNIFNPFNDIELEPNVPEPLLASGTIFDISAQVADLFFLNNHLFSPIFDILKTAILNKLSDFLSKRQENQAFH